MALLNMRKFAKVNGISYYNMKKYVEDGIIRQDENGMIDSGECIRILRKELQDSLKHYTVYLTPNNQMVVDSIRTMMDDEAAVEVSSFDGVCIRYNKALQERAVEVAGDICKKYKAEVLEEFIKRYKSCVNRQVPVLFSREGIGSLSYKAVHDFVAFGIFPEGYEHLKGDTLSSHLSQGVERFLLKCDEEMENKFHKICRDLLLYWEGSDDETVFERSDISEDFLSDTKRSQLYRDIINNPNSFMIGRSIEQPTEIFEGLKSNCKASFKSAVLAEFSAKRFYRMVVLHDGMSHDEGMRLIHDLRVSNCSECIVCGTRDSLSGYIPDGLMMYLDSMQYDRADSVIYAGESVVAASRSAGVSGVVSVEAVKDSGVASEVSGVASVSETPKVEVISQSEVEVVSKEDSEIERAADAIQDLLTSVG